jgi:SagB-type dehydrogenase family enzyme
VPDSALRFRRSPYLVTYWRGRCFFVYNYVTHRERLLPPATTEVLNFFDEGRTAIELAARTGLSPTAAEETIARLVEADALEREDRPRSARESAMERWGSWNPAAGFFHSATRDVFFVDPREGNQRLREKAAAVPLPPAVKRYPRARTRQLSRVSAGSEFPRVLLARRTWRQFSKRLLPFDALSTLLGLTGGIQHWATAPGQGKLPLKTSPSGGARHPIELYVWARRVENLTPGLYHYAPDRHRVELLKGGPQPASAGRYLPGQFWYDDAPAIVFFSAVYARYLWKYTYARAYRATLIEAGHQCQTFCLIATWLRLAPFCSMALADSEVEADLGLDGVSESVLYAAGVGIRPRGSTVRSHAPGSTPIRIRTNPLIVQR